MGLYNVMMEILKMVMDVQVTVKLRRAGFATVEVHITGAYVSEILNQ